MNHLSTDFHFQPPIFEENWLAEFHFCIENNQKVRHSKKKWIPRRFQYVSLKIPTCFFDLTQEKMFMESIFLSKWEKDKVYFNSFQFKET